MVATDSEPMAVPHGYAPLISFNSSDVVLLCEQNRFEAVICLFLLV